MVSGPAPSSAKLSLEAWSLKLHSKLVVGEGWGHSCLHCAKSRPREERLTDLPHAQLLTPPPNPNFTIRLAVCKIQRQLNAKHIVSQEKLEGSRGHHASLGRASEPIRAWGRRPAAPLPFLPPASLPYNRVPRLCLPSWQGWGGGVIWEPDVQLQPQEGRGAEGERGRMAFGILTDGDARRHVSSSACTGTSGF